MEVDYTQEKMWALDGIRLGLQEPISYINSIS